MANKTMNSRIQLKHDTEAHWLLAVGFSPKAGEVIIYDVDSTYTYPRFKVGDGLTNVNSLPFVTAEAAQKAIDNTITAGSSSTNLPTSAAVAAFVEGKGYTTNIGTITGITMNGTSRGTSGIIDLGTVITSHQDITGKADLDSNGKILSSQLPSYVDDVLEYTSVNDFPATGETGKIYIDTTTNLTYRWSGSIYIEIASPLALGTTSATAFRGDYGNSAYVHAVTNKGSAFTSGLYKITTNEEGHVIAATTVAKSDITALDIPESDTHRIIKVDNVQALGNDTTALNLKAGSNITITDDGSGEITFAATAPTSIASTEAPDEITYLASVQGTSINYARQDHTHGIAVTTGDANGQIKIAGYNVSVKGLGTNAYIPIPLFITTSNNSVSDALTHGTATTLSTGQLVFVTLNKAMAGNTNATLKLGNKAAINIYLTGTTQLQAPYAAGTMLGLVYNGTNLYMINPPVAI